MLIAAPTDQHVELVETLAGAGVPVLCEKPVGTRAADAIAAAAAVEQAGIAFQVGYWRRFVPELRALRERIVAGELGEILQISLPAVGRRAAVGSVPGPQWGDRGRHGRCTSSTRRDG